MASKQPFKFINVTQKLTTWSIRLNKFFKHRLLSKRKNALLIGEDNPFILSTSQTLKNNTRTQTKSIKTDLQTDSATEDFQNFLIKYMTKTWQITQIKSTNKNNIQVGNKQIIQTEPNEGEPSNIKFSNFNNKSQIQSLQKYFTQKKKYFDAIIVMPQKQSQIKYPQIKDEEFATSYIDIFQQKIMKNVIAYRIANKFLNTSGCLIQSSSEYDFLKKTDQEKQKQQKKALENKEPNNQQILSYAKCRLPASKQILDNVICYMGVVVGDRDYTDLNSWTLVSLSQEASRQNPSYVAKMYYDWADGQQLPMPGSFTIFKKKILQNKKEFNYVQYL